MNFDEVMNMDKVEFGDMPPQVRRPWKTVRHLCSNRNSNHGDREPAISLIRKAT